MLDKTFAFLESVEPMLPDPMTVWAAQLSAAKEEVRALRSLPEIVCLVGSTRFADTFKDENLRLTLQGAIVLGIGADNIHSETPPELRVGEPQKALLDALQFRKIELANRVHVINVNGYIGKSTYAEIKRAYELDKAITFLCEYVLTWTGAHVGNRISTAHLLKTIRDRLDLTNSFDYS